MQKINPILSSDSYKISHWLQYPPDTKRVFSYIEARGSNMEGIDWNLFFGIRGFVEEFLKQPVTWEDIEEAEWYFSRHGVTPWNRDGWETIVREFDGYMPLRVRAVPEGTRVPQRNVLVTVENTDDRFYWLPTYVETSILRAIWYPTTVATISRDIKDVLLEYHEKTSDEDPFGVNFKLQDFGCRGTTSLESAGIGGAAHLVNFMGTDTIPALRWIRGVYGDEDIAGFSIPASEHSTMTTWGPEGEPAAIENMIDQFGGEGTLLACVMDSYDLWNVIDNYLPEGSLGEKIRNHGGTLVVRPDSGVPENIVPKVINRLMDHFGYELNSKGFKVLPPFIRVIQGDGIDRDTARSILRTMTIKGLSIDNIVFGMGGALLQRMDRDTFKFAMKCSAVKIGDEWHRVYKDPVTDSGKKSKAGYLDLMIDRNGDTRTFDRFVNDCPYSSMVTVYEDGESYYNESFSDVRERSNRQ